MSFPCAQLSFLLVSLSPAVAPALPPWPLLEPAGRQAVTCPLLWLWQTSASPPRSCGGDGPSSQSCFLPGKAPKLKKGIETDSRSWCSPGQVAYLL